MDWIHKCCCHRNQNLILSIMFLLISSSTNYVFRAEGRATPSCDQADQKTPSQIRAQMIGSRPPRCNFRSSTCGPCQPIQVPVNPQLHNRNHGRARSRYHYETLEIAYSRGDDVTNYKPMGWKCKCGNLIFNP